MAAGKKDDGARTRMIVQDLGRAHPDARFELDFTTPLELLVALILAAQFRDDRVNAITPPLFVPPSPLAQCWIWQSMPVSALHRLSSIALDCA